MLDNLLKQNYILKKMTQSFKNTLRTQYSPQRNVQLFSAVFQGKNRVWKCFDDRTARWTEYNVTNNKAIDAAYQKGEGAVRIMTGRRWYNIQFSSMVQVGIYLVSFIFSGDQAALRTLFCPSVRLLHL